MKSDLLQKDQQHIWHPFTSQKDMSPVIPVISGKGTLLYSEDGKSYIDAISSWWVTLHGHAHPYIAEKIYQQALTLEQVIFAGFTHPPAVELAERLLPLLPGKMAKVFYSDNGSTSTEVALKMSVQYWWNKSEPGRKKILAFRNSYHGDTFGAMSVSERSVFTLAFHDKLFEVIFIDTPNEENIDDLKRTVKQHAHAIAAFIYEPLVQGAGGMKMYDATLLNDLLNTLQSQNIICIADEVMTGFGRTGKLFASEYINARPDIICLSKGLTGGTMALGVTACSNKIHEAFVSVDKLKTFFHGHSFTANPLACSAALASLDLLLKDECVQQISWITKRNEQFCKELNRIKEIKNIRHLGTIAAFEIDNGNDEYLNDISFKVTNFCLEKGVYVRPLGNTVYVMPPYCILEEELDKVYSVLIEFLNIAWTHP